MVSTRGIELDTPAQIPFRIGHQLTEIIGVGMLEVIMLENIGTLRALRNQTENGSSPMSVNGWKLNCREKSFLARTLLLLLQPR